MSRHMLLLAVVGLLAVVCRADIVSQGNDTQAFSCDICSSTLQPLLSLLVSAPNCSDVLVDTIHNRCMSGGSSPAQGELCSYRLAKQCASTVARAVMVASEAALLLDQNSTDHELTKSINACAFLGATGRACAVAAAEEQVALAMAEASTRLSNSGGLPVARHHKPLKTTDKIVLDLPPRYMWGWGPGLKGYCGATSIQTAGLYYGNYYSQEQVRYAAGNQEVLIDVNADAAASILQLTFEKWHVKSEKKPQDKKFLTWFKKQINNGVPVILGIFEQQPKGDTDYDHVVLAMGYEVSPGHRAVAEVYFNDWYLNQHRVFYVAKDVRPREDCHQDDTPVQPYTYCMPRDYISSIAITGNIDPNAELYPVSLDVGSWSEPDWGSEDHINAPPVKFFPSATVSLLTIGTQYSLLRFDDPSYVPLGGFFAGPWTQVVNFTAVSATQVLNGLRPIWSNGTYFYRCVVSPV